MDTVKVAIVDDHQIFRDGLKLLFSLLKNVEVIWEASNGKIFLESIDRHFPDIVFMDINMKEMDGIEASRMALEKYPEIKIIVLTSFDYDEYFYRMNDLGVKGYLMKNSNIEDFEKAIRKVSEGYNYYSDELIAKLTKMLKIIEKKEKLKREVLNFTEEEKTLLKFICQGLTNKQIADLIHLSSRTIETHRAKLLAKTKTNNSVALAVYAISNKLVEI